MIHQHELGQERFTGLSLQKLMYVVALTFLLLVVGFFIWLFFFFTFEGPSFVQEAALADLNGDGHLDAFITINPDGEPYCAQDLILFGDGNGRFTISDQKPENCNAFAVSLGDVNNDGMVDAVVGNQLYKNFDNGRFTNGSFLPSESDGAFRWQVRLADLNGDGALDMFAATCCGGMISQPVSNQRPLFANDVVFINNGQGQFINSGQFQGNTGSNAVALGDLNGDGTIDAFIAKGQNSPGNRSSFKNPNVVWLNDGSGQFTYSGQRLGNEESTAVALSDFDNDGDLDALVGNNGRDELWLNDGRGNFSLSSQRFNSDDTRTVLVADFNEDGNTDIVITGERSSRVWLNDGTAVFQFSQQLRHEDDSNIALGDLNEDGMVDILIASVTEHEVWLGEGNGRFSSLP